MRCLLLVSLLLVTVSACASRTVESESVVHDLSPQEVSDVLEAKEERDLFVLNVHTPYEGELAGTDAFIEDWENIAAHQDVLPLDKSRPLLVYCRSGRMSSSAVKQLETLGYETIYHLEGGMRAWNDAGLPLINYTAS